MDEREITHYFIVANQLHRRMMESNLEGMRIHRAQHRLLMTLSCKRSYSQVEIAKELEVSPATIAVALKNLENKGITGWRLSILDTDNQGATVSIA